MNPITKPGLSRGLATLMFFLFGLKVAAQVTIATSLPGCLDAGIQKSGISCGGGASEFGISGNQFIVRNIDGGACCAAGGDGNAYFEFPSIDISGFEDVSLSLSYAASNTTYEEAPGGPHFGCTGNFSLDNGHDQILFSYSINGGPFMNSNYVHGTTAADFTGTWREDRISGNTLKIRIWASTKAAVEIFSFFNLIITGFPIPVSAGPDMIVCGQSPVALTASGAGTWSGGSGTFQYPGSPNSLYTPGPGEIGKTVLLTYRGRTKAPACGPVASVPEDQMALSILPPPTLFAPPDQLACQGFTLGPISGTNLSNTAYFTGPNRSGNQLYPGQTLFSSSTVYLSAGTPGCSDEKSFSVAIAPLPEIFSPGTLEGCREVVLPPFSGLQLTDAAYYTAPNGKGMRYYPGDLIFTSTQLFAYAGIPGCSDQEDFLVNVFPQPHLEPILPQIACDSYQLPPIRGSSLSGSEGYFTKPDGIGTRLPVGTVLHKGGTFFAFDALNTCTAERSFSLSIFSRPFLLPQPDTTTCGFFVLPKIKGDSLSGRQAYFTGPSGSGLRRVEGDTLFASTLLYAFDTIGLCAAQDTFQITIRTAPNLATIPDTVFSCQQFTLPAIAGTSLSGKQAYYTGPQGSGTKLHAGQIIQDTTRLYLFDSIGTCTSEQSFLVLTVQPVQLDTIPDTLACSGFSLPQINGAQLSGNEAYYTGPGGTGLRYLPGEIWKSSSTLFAFGGLAPGCTAERSFSLLISEGPLPVLSRTASIRCFGDATAALRLGISKGIAPYHVEWWDGNTDSLSRTGLPAGTYQVTVTDSGDCTATTSIEITQPNEIRLSCAAIQPVSRINGEDGIAEIGISGGTGRFNLQINGPIGISQNGLMPDQYPITRLKPGTYSVTVRDSSDCRKTCSFYIPEPGCSLQAALESSNPSCASSSNGAISVRVSNGTAPYRFNWSSGHLGPEFNTLSGIGPGTYRVTVSDATQCKDTLEVTITSPQAIDLQCKILSSVSEFGLNDGRVQLLAMGGTAPFRFTVSGKITAEYSVAGSEPVFLENLYAGTYTVLTRDAKGCLDSCSIQLAQPPCRMAINLTSIAPTCTGEATGSISANINNARKPFRYQWNAAILNGKSGGSGLIAGKYAVTVTDSVGCTAVAQLQIQDPQAIKFRCIFSVPTRRVNGKDGTQTVSLEGGNPPYSLQLTGSKQQTYTAFNQGFFTVDSLPRGEYTLAVTDSKGCTATSCNFRIEDPKCDLEVALTGKAPTCSGSSNGSIITTISNAVRPFKLAWNRSGLGQTLNPTGLPAGVYLLEVTDDRLCKDTVRLELKDPIPLQLQCRVLQEPQTVGGSEGIVQIFSSGGTGQRILTWSGPGLPPNPLPDTLTLKGVSAGNYSARIADANNCTETCNLTLLPIQCTLKITAESAPARCFGEASGAVRIYPSGAKGSLLFRWSNGAVTPELQNVPAGAYSVTATDAALCKDSASTFIFNPPSLILDAAALSAPTGLNRADGRAHLYYTGGKPPYSLSWTGPVNGQIERGKAGKDTLNVFPAGTYTCTLRDSNGCQDMAIVTINPFLCPLSATLRQEPLGCETASLFTTINGATGPLYFDWDRNELDGQQNPSPVRAGPYKVRISDTTGCSVEAAMTVTVSGPMLLTLEAIDGHCAGDPGSIVVEKIQGGRKPYEVFLNNSPTRQIASTPLTLRGIQPGDVRLRVRSSDGCGLDTLLRINPVAKPLMELGPDQEILRGDSLELQPLIGFDPKTVRWIPETGLDRPDALSVIASPDVTITYLLSVTDQKGCPVEDKVTVIVRDQAPVFFPSAFSPNGDGSNDYFTGFAGPLVQVIEKLHIFDRWGQLLFEGTAIPPNLPTGGWDGSVKQGGPAPAGVYVYRAIVRLQNGKTASFAGEIIVVR